MAEHILEVDAKNKMPTGIIAKIEDKMSCNLAMVVAVYSHCASLVRK